MKLSNRQATWFWLLALYAASLAFFGILMWLGHLVVHYLLSIQGG